VSQQEGMRVGALTTSREDLLTARQLAPNSGACKPAGKPGSVSVATAGAFAPGSRAAEDGHPSGTPVTRRLERPDPGHEERATPGRRNVRPLFGLAPGGVYLAGRSPGRRWALTPPFHRCPDCSGLCHFCGTLLRVTPTGRYPAPLLCGARTFLERQTPSATVLAGLPSHFIRARACQTRSR
jgi:hypothetical protein